METVREKMTRTEAVVGRIYLWLTLFGLPLVIHNGYFDITEAKTLWFTVWTVIFLIARFICAVQNGESLRVSSAAVWAGLVFALVCLFSTALSGRLSESFFGPRGRWQGAGMMVLYALLFASFSVPGLRERDVFLPLAAGMTLTGILAVLQHQGLSVPGLDRELIAFDRGRYISTLGNINLAGAYFSLTAPTAAALFLTEEKKSLRVWWGGVLLAGLWAAMAVRSESTILGIGTAMLLMPGILRHNGNALRRFPLLFVFLGVGMWAYALVCGARGAYLSALTRFLLYPWVTGTLAVGGILGWLWCRRADDGVLRRRAKGWCILLAVMLAAGGVCILLLNTVLRHIPLGELGEWLRFSESWGTDRGRVWAYCLEIYGEFAPLEKLIGGGCGILARIDVTRRIFPDAVLDTAHCEYLQILLNWGLLGLAAYLIWIGKAFRDLIRKDSRLSLALLAGLIAYAAQASVNIAQTPGIALFFVLLAVSRS